MIYPKKNNIIRWFFHTYARWITGRNFHAINFNTIDIDKNRSVLLIANHFGWWDGPVLYEVNCKLLKKKFHIMILEKTAKRIPILKYGGAFSINRGSGAQESLDFAAQLLTGPQNMVLMFPQGKLYSNFVNEVEFEKGVIKTMGQAAVNFQLVFAASFIEYFEHKKPTVNVYLKTVDADNFTVIEELQTAYQQHYNAARLQQTQITVQ